MSRRSTMMLEPRTFEYPFGPVPAFVRENSMENLYDNIKDILILKRDSTGAITAKTKVDLVAFRFLVDKDGNVPDPPYPACQILTQGLPLLLTKDEIEVHYNEA